LADAKIDFNDGSAATLQSPVPAPGNRFRNWTPDRVPVGHFELALGTGVTSKFEFREDFTATLEVHNLRPAQLTVALRLKAHLLNGGTCTVTTADASANVYTCRLAPGTIPQIRMTDPRLVEFAMMLALKNTAAAVLIASY
jgi:hypothetical protein